MASVDGNGVLEVIDLHTQSSLFKTENVVSVSFNSEVKDMLCYTTKVSMHIVSGIGAAKTDIEPDEMPYSGQVIAFRGQRIVLSSRRPNQSCGCATAEGNFSSHGAE